MEKADRICNDSQEIREKVALELRASFPFPVILYGEVLIRAFYYARFGPPPAAVDDLYPPKWLVTLSSDKGQIISLERKPPEFYGINGAPNQPFAQHAYTHYLSLESMEKDKKQFFQAYDNLVNEWITSKFNNNDSQSKKAFRELFNRLSPPPLLKSYLIVGRDFFNWMGFNSGLK